MYYLIDEAVMLYLDVLLQAANLLYFLSWMESLGILGEKLNVALSHLGSFSYNSRSLSFLFLNPLYNGQMQ